MGKKDKKKGAGAAKTAAKTEKKANQKLKKELARRGEEDVEAMLAKKVEEEEGGAGGIAEEEEVEAPSRRTSFTLVPHPDKDQLVLFGGEYFNGSSTMMYNDLYFYNIKADRWVRLTTPSPPPPRAGHQAITVAQGGGQMWIFGGEFTSPSQSQFHHFKDLWVFHFTHKRWEKIVSPGGPSPRSGHRMVLSRRQLVVFGGFRDNGRTYTYLNDSYAFSLDDYKWTIIRPAGTPPSPRSACQMAAHTDGHIVVSGGYSRQSVKKDADQGITHTDMYTLTPENSGWRWRAVKQGGVVPSPRSGFSLSQPPLGEKVYLFGGVFDRKDEEEELEGVFYNDLFQLDLTKHVWRTVNITGRKEVGEKKRRRRKREGRGEEEEEEEEEEMEEQMERMKMDEDDGEMVKSDGVFTVTVGPAPQAAQSSGPSVRSAEVFVPSPRINPGLVVKKGVLYLYGGMYEVGDRQYTLGDFYALDLGKLDEWKVIISPEEESAMEWVESESEEEDSDDDSDDDDDDDDDDDEMDVD